MIKETGKVESSPDRSVDLSWSHASVAPYGITLGQSQSYLDTFELTPRDGRGWENASLIKSENRYVLNLFTPCGGTKGANGALQISLGTESESAAHAEFFRFCTNLNEYQSVNAPLAVQNVQGPLFDLLNRPEVKLQASDKVALTLTTTISMRDLLQNDPIAAEKFLREEVYPVHIQSFLDENETEPPESILKYLKDPKHFYDIEVGLIGRTVVGGRHYRILEDAVSTKEEVLDVTFEGRKIAMGEFLYVGKNFRVSGLGTQIDARANDKMFERGAGLRLTEVNYSHAMSAEAIALDIASGIHPDNRMIFWDKRGVGMVIIPFAQAAFSEDTLPVDHLRLGAQRLYGDPRITEIPLKTLKAAILSYEQTFAQRGNVTILWLEATYNRMLHEKPDAVVQVVPFQKAIKEKLALGDEYKVVTDINEITKIWPTAKF